MFVITYCYSIGHEVHNVNKQLLYNSDKVKPTQYMQYTESTIQFPK